MFDDWETDDDFLKDFQEEGSEKTIISRPATPNDSRALKKRKLNLLENAKDLSTSSDIKNRHILDLFANKEDPLKTKDATSDSSLLPETRDFHPEEEKSIEPCTKNSRQEEKTSIIESLPVKSKDKSGPTLPKSLSLFESHEDMDFDAWDDNEFNFENREKTDSCSEQKIKENSRTLNTEDSKCPENIPEERNKELSSNSMEKNSTEEKSNQSNTFQKPNPQNPKESNNFSSKAGPEIRSGENPKTVSNQITTVAEIHKESTGFPGIEATSRISELQNKESVSSRLGKDLDSIWEDIELELESERTDFFSGDYNETAPERGLGRIGKKTETVGLQKQVADENLISPIGGTSSKRDFILGVFDRKVDETNDKSQPGARKTEKVPETIGIHTDKITTEAQKASKLQPRLCDAPKPESSRMDSILRSFRKAKSESELDSTKVHRKSTPKKNIIFQRKFPGPAGLKPVQEPNQSVSEVKNVDEVKEETINSSKNESFFVSQRTKDLFSEGMWEFMTSELPTGFLSNFEIHRVKERAKVKPKDYVKVPYLAGIIDKLEYKYNKSLIVLKDMTDSINGTLYLDLHSTYDNNMLNVGTVLLLKDAGLIKSGTNHHPRVLITQKEIIGIYTSEQQILRTEDLRSIIAASENLENRKNAESRDRSEEQIDSSEEGAGIVSHKTSQTEVRSDIEVTDRREKVPESLANSQSKTSSRSASNETIQQLEPGNSSFCSKTRNLDLNDESRKSPPRKTIIAEKLSKFRYKEVPPPEESLQREPPIEDFFNDDDDLLCQIETGNSEKLAEKEKEEKAKVPIAPNNFFTLDDAFDEALSQMDVDFLS